jgi:hypothetical protein
MEFGNGRSLALLGKKSVCISVQHLLLDEPQNIDVRIGGHDACSISSFRVSAKTKLQMNGQRKHVRKDTRITQGEKISILIIPTEIFLCVYTKT